MPVDPGIKGLLDLMASFNAPPMPSLDAATARSRFRDFVVGMQRPELLIPVAGTEDIKIDGAAGPIAARIYRPEPANPVPTVVFLHGGGFVLGDIDTHENQARRVCHETGAVVVSIDYRLAPEAPWPAASDDCLAAVRWAAEHIDELGGDPRRLAVAGDSAGGNLSAVTAIRCRDEDGPRLAAQLLIYPATDFTQDPGELYPSRLDNAEGYFLTLEELIWFSGHYAGDADVEDPRLSPIKASLEGLPPAVVVTAEFDPLRDEGNAYAEALEAAGVDVRFRCFEGLIHGFFDMGIISPAAEQASIWACAQLRELLG